MLTDVVLLGVCVSQPPGRKAGLPLFQWQEVGSLVTHTGFCRSLSLATRGLVKSMGLARFKSIATTGETFQSACHTNDR